MKNTSTACQCLFCEHGCRCECRVCKPDVGSKHCGSVPPFQASLVCWSCKLHWEIAELSSVPFQGRQRHSSCKKCKRITYLVGDDFKPPIDFAATSSLSSLSIDKWHKLQNLYDAGVRFTSCAYCSWLLWESVIRCDQADVARELLEHARAFALPTLHPEGRLAPELETTPLHLAATHGALQCAWALLSHGNRCTIDCTRGRGPPLQCAVQAGQLEMIKYLLQAGASITAYPDALFDASHSCRADVVRQLRLAGAAVMPPTFGGRHCTPYHGVVEGAHPARSETTTRHKIVEVMQALTDCREDTDGARLEGLSREALEAALKVRNEDNLTCMDLALKRLQDLVRGRRHVADFDSKVEELADTIIWLRLGGSRMPAPAPPVPGAAHSGESWAELLRAVLFDCQEAPRRGAVHVAAASGWMDSVVELMNTGAEVAAPVGPFFRTAMHYVVDVRFVLQIRHRARPPSAVLRSPYCLFECEFLSRGALATRSTRMENSCAVVIGPKHEWEIFGKMRAYGMAN
ncbi:hypothetical protein CYMTET_38769 [Cymbomonas tetramitiformis]|uniref:Uncharacterized protein n=1 Tax=Cymbomonas tetramitiformis TaxID=36881 RepID=A0AAE0CBD5_9CHLO|nr:hypothetical protein CYMTET_38769 [Cymbomonas tetramitiformis]